MPKVNCFVSGMGETKRAGRSCNNEGEKPEIRIFLPSRNERMINDGITASIYLRIGIQSMFWHLTRCWHFVDVTLHDVTWCYRFKLLLFG